MGSPFSKTLPSANPAQRGSPFGEDPVIVTGFNPPALPVYRFYATFSGEDPGTVTAAPGGVGTAVTGTHSANSGILTSTGHAITKWSGVASRGFQTTISVGTISALTSIFFCGTYDTSISGYRLSFGYDIGAGDGAIQRMDASTASTLATFTVTSQSDVYLNVPVDPAADITVIASGGTIKVADATHTGSVWVIQTSDSTFNAPMAIIEV